MKYAHLEKETNKLLGWYADDVHGKWINPVYEPKVIQEEEKDEYGNTIKEKITDNVLVKDGYYDISNIPTPNIPVSEEVWQEAVNINANCYKDKKFIVKDFRTVDEIEAQRVLLIKTKASELIESKYSMYKQLNITNLLTPYTEQDKELMKTFIDRIREIANISIDNGADLEDIIWQ